tara:strand:- start:963 stop:1163 length:201 start_codon:yes stop_codon:yes gene_type:complete
MKPTHLVSPARTSLLEIRPCRIRGWEAVITQWNGGHPLTEQLVALASDGEAANLRSKLIHKGWIEQ